MNIVEEIKTKISREIVVAIQKSGLVNVEQLPDVILDTPKEKEHGDYATNIAMQLTKTARKPPRQIAEEIISHFDKEKGAVEKIEVAGPGFLNFFMDYRFLTKLIFTILRAGENYGASDTGQGKKVQVEFVSVNPTGRLHLGHARGAAVGDTLCNLLKMAGYDVSREYYNNDAGNQIRTLTLSVEARYFQALGIERKLPEDGYHGNDISQLGKDLVLRYGEHFVHVDKQERYHFFREYSLKHVVERLKEDLTAFRVHFDRWFSERSLHESGEIEKVLARLEEKGETYEKDEAIWFRSTAYGDDKDRVLVKGDGSYTYLMPDIAYHLNKFGRGFETLINVWGADHHGYIPRMKAAVEALGYHREQLQVQLIQIVNLFQNGERIKMSKRTGKSVTLRELMDEVGVDAMRYFLVMRSPDTHLDFDVDLAVSHSNENPVYYAQYAHARVCSILRQGRKMGFDSVNPTDVTLLCTEKEIDLLKKLGEFPEMVAGAAQKRAVQRVTRYVNELAAALHRFYNAERVIDDSDPKRSMARFQFMKAVQITLQNALALIGVSAPEKM